MFHFNDGDVLLDRFEIKKLLGAGGMGEVYKAFDKKLKRNVAVKTLRTNSLNGSIKTRERFLNEGLLTAKLNHPNIVNLYDVLQDSDSIYLIMEYLNGEPLNKIIKNRKIDKKNAEKIYHEIQSALKYLHNQEPPILHQDVSPHNIFITKDGRAKLIDYGISKIVVLDKEDTSTSYYKLSYTCPELWNDGVYAANNYTEKHDLYSLALVYYEMLTGEKVFYEMEAVKGFPKNLATCGDREIDDFILTGVYSFNSDENESINYIDQTITNHRKVDSGTKRTFKLSKIIGALLLFISIIIGRHLYQNADIEVNVLFKKDSIEGAGLESIDKTQCLAYAHDMVKEFSKSKKEVLTDNQSRWLLDFFEVCDYTFIKVIRKFFSKDVKTFRREKLKGFIPVFYKGQPRENVDSFMRLKKKVYGFKEALIHEFKDLKVYLVIPNKKYHYDRNVKEVLDIAYLQKLENGYFLDLPYESDTIYIGTPTTVGKILNLNAQQGRGVYKRNSLIFEYGIYYYFRQKGKMIRFENYLP